MPRNIDSFIPIKMISGLCLMMFLYFLPNLLILAGVDYFVVNDIKKLILHEIYTWLVPGLIYLYVVKVEKQQLIPLKEKEYNMKWYFVNLIKLYFMCLGLTLLVYLVMKLTGANIHSLILEKMIKVFKDHQWMVVMVSLRAGVTEELIFRGYVYGRLEQYFKRTWIPILISATLFSLFHISYGTLSNLLFPFLLGLLFAWHYHKYRNIKLLIVLHFLWDLLSINAAVR